MRLLLIALASAALAQQPWQIELAGDVEKPVKLTATDLAAMPRSTVETTREGATTRYEGVLLQDVIRKAVLKGKPLNGYLSAEGSDGYKVVFALGELDPATGDRAVLIADRANGKPLGEKEGPVRLVVPGDKRAARSVRMLIRLEVVMLK